MTTFDQLQQDHKEWADRNFPEGDWRDALMGLTEELGELAHSLLKQKQGIRGSYSYHEANAQDAVGDILLYLVHLCNYRDWNLQMILDKTTQEVLLRDWNTNNKTGEIDS